MMGNLDNTLSINSQKWDEFGPVQKININHKVEVAHLCGDFETTGSSCLRNHEKPHKHT